MATVISGTDGVSVNGKTLANVPAGTIAYFGLNIAPDGYLKADGSAVSRTTYSTLYAVIGDLYGVGDGSTTFNLPDLRGEFIRGADEGRGVDAGRSVGSSQSDAFKSHNHNHTYILDGGNQNAIVRNWSSSSRAGTQTGTTTSTGDSETRPRNVAMLACIKY